MLISVNCPDFAEHQLCVEKLEGFDPEQSRQCTPLLFLDYLLGLVLDLEFRDMQSLLTVQTTDVAVASLDLVGDFAAAQNAHLTVIVLGIAAPAPSMVFPEVPAYDWGLAYDQTLQLAQARATEIKERLSKRDVSVTAIATCQSMAGIADMMGKNALYVDYVMLPPLGSLSDTVHDRCLYGALFDAGVPVIVLPENQTKSPELKTIMAAWYPSPHTARAIRRVTGLVNRKSTLHIAIVDPKEHIYGPNPGDDIAAYLARKGLDVNVDRIPSNDDELASVLRNKALDVNADLVVMGAYGHSRMREWLLGSTTSRMLRDFSMPLLLCH